MFSPLFIDVDGYVLSPAEKVLLRHPLVGGVILFARNYLSKNQLKELVAEIKKIDRPKPLLIAVDQEGGRVQRFDSDFTELPSAHSIGRCFDRNPTLGMTFAKLAGFVMAGELLDCGIDFSFAPVLDLDFGISEIIGSRSFHRNASAVAILAKEYITAMHHIGMACVAKHFPGHGAVAADSHLELPEDNRVKEAIFNHDLLPYRDLIRDGLISAVMPAHIRFSQLDNEPAGFSSYWLKTVLRGELGFKGVIISDDLMMNGAKLYPNIVDRVNKAMDAGCDMVLICNNREAVLDVIQHYRPQETPDTPIDLLYAKFQVELINLTDEINHLQEIMNNL